MSAVKIKVVVLDAVALRDGDMDWSTLEEVASELVIYSHTTNDMLIERIGDAEAIIINKGQINEEVLSRCTKLRFIGLTATGYDNIDISSCRRHGVAVANVPGYSTDSVAQQLFALLLEYCTDTAGYSAAVRRGDWLGRMSDIGSLRRMSDLCGKTLGIIGFGNIGGAVAKIALAFGMKVIGYSPNPKVKEGINFCSLEQVLRQSDIVSLHCRLSHETEKLIDANRLAMMKKGAVLCNVSRGGVVDDHAVLEALESGQLGFYLADVLTGEPHTENHPLINAKNTLITPHVAWATQNSLARLADEVCDNLKAFCEGIDRNLVS